MGHVKSRSLILILLIIAIIVLFVLNLLSVPMKTLTFETSDKTILNPSRGFYVQYDSAYTENPAEIKMSDLRNHGISLAMIAFDIKDFRDSPISPEKLQELDSALQNAKKFGLKVIFRAAYGFTEYSIKNDSTDIETIKAHIDQIAPVLNKNMDVIYVVQAGFLGAWGEWHSSNLLGNDEQKNTIVRNEVVSYLSQKLDSSIVINLRRPRFIRDAIAAGVSSTRLGLHNDALLSSPDDMGTYDDPTFTKAADIEWLRQNMASSINGGEMPTVGEFSKFENAVNELNALHIGYLNHEYNKEALKSWETIKVENSNGLSYIEKHLGYRISISSARMPEQLRQNSALNFSFTLINQGYASPPSNFSLDAVLRIDGKNYYYPLDSVTVSSILSNNNSTFEARIDPPKDYQGNTMKIGLRIRPVEESIEDDIRYSIEFVNKTTQFIDGTNYFCEYVNKDHIYSLQRQF